MCIHMCIYIYQYIYVYIYIYKIYIICIHNTYVHAHVLRVRGGHAVKKEQGLGDAVHTHTLYIYYTCNHVRFRSYLQCAQGGHAVENGQVLGEAQGILHEY